MMDCVIYLIKTLNYRKNYFLISDGGLGDRLFRYKQKSLREELYIFFSSKSGRSEEYDNMI
jgi:hypothetical protein